MHLSKIGASCEYSLRVVSQVNNHASPESLASHFIQLHTVTLLSSYQQEEEEKIEEYEANKSKNNDDNHNHKKKEDSMSSIEACDYVNKKKVTLLYMK